jgi:hypothetical protein
MDAPRGALADQQRSATTDDVPAPVHPDFRFTINNDDEDIAVLVDVLRDLLPCRPCQQRRVEVFACSAPDRAGAPRGEQIDDLLHRHGLSQRPEDRRLKL